MRIVAAILVSVAALGAGTAHPQSAPANPERAGSAPQESPDEVVVRGRRIEELRAEVEAARQAAYAIFNEVNTDDEFDVRCRKESRAGTNVPQQVCRARFEDDISAEAAREYMSTLFTLCQPDANGFLDTQACLFSGPGASAAASAQSVESRESSTAQTRPND